LSFAEGDKKMILKYPKTGSQYVYQVLYAEKNQITLLIQDEERRTELGDRVMWVLVLNDPNSYQWRRTDWKSDARTKEIVRCQGR
jgi:cell division septal protein FtsQ